MIALKHMKNVVGFLHGAQYLGHSGSPIFDRFVQKTLDILKGDDYHLPYSMDDELVISFGLNVTPPEAIAEFAMEPLLPGIHVTFLTPDSVIREDGQPARLKQNPVALVQASMFTFRRPQSSFSLMTVIVDIRSMGGQDVLHYGDAFEFDDGALATAPDDDKVIEEHVRELIDHALHRLVYGEWGQRQQLDNTKHHH